MGNVTPLGQDPTTQKQHELVSAIARTDKFGVPQPQEGSNGQEFLFHCPICIEDDGKGEGHRPHLFIAKATQLDRNEPYAGCRIHDSPADWKRIKRALISAGVSGALLGERVLGTKGAGGVDKSFYAEFKSKPVGLGESNPIPEGRIQRWKSALFAGSSASAQALAYLESRGLTPETITAAELGLAGNKLILPIRGAEGSVVSARYRVLGRASNWKPYPHPKLKNEATGRPLTYGPPTRLYGVRELRTDADSGSLGADGLASPVWVCAGEFDRLILTQNGLLSVTGTSGEGSLPRLEDAQYLAGRDVYIVMDCDAAGRRAAKKWAAASVKIGVASARIIDLDPTRTDGYDISDFFAEHVERDESGEFDVIELLAAKVNAAAVYELPGGADIRLDELSDRRMAEIVAQKYLSELRFVTQGQTWIHWDGKRWVPFGARDNSAATNAIVATAREIRRDVLTIADGDEEFAATLSKFMHQYLNRQHSSVREHLSVMESMRVDLDSLDRLPVLNTPAGILDLTTGETRPHDSRAMLRWMTNGSYVDGRKFPEWSAFVKRVLPSMELRRYVQKLLGYSLLDGNPHRLLIFVKGGTSTGKSVFAETVMEALGSYAGPFNMSLLRDNQDEKPRADIVDSLTQRIIFASETSSAWHLHADAIKRMTGGDTIKARLPHVGQYVERIPAFTPWVRTNAVPSVNAADAALERRLVVIPFNETIRPEEEDPVAMDRLRRSSGDAVISWAVRGLTAFLRDGLGDVPVASIEAKFEFSSQLSPMHVFLEEMCDRGPESDHEYWIPIAELYGAYENWASSAGIREIINKIEFGKRLSDIGIPVKVSNSVRYRLGIRFKSDMAKGVH